MLNNIKVHNLRCEYLINPIGIDALKPRFSWVLNSEKRNVLQSAYRIQVSADINGFENLLWDSGKVSSDQSVHVEYDGEPLESRRRYYYRVKVWDNYGNEGQWSETAFWEMGLLNKEEWTAKWITADEVIEKGSSPLFRTEFKAEKGIKEARVYATALGLYEVYINGVRVGDSLLTPGWTEYDKRLQYQTYDVTELLKDGENAAGVILGKGWYSGNLAWEDKKSIYGDKTAILFQLFITYEDGQEKLIISDETWKYSEGPILMSEIYHGEIYDARVEKTGWNMPGFHESNWKQVQLLEHTKDILVAQENVPVKRMNEIKPVGIFTTPKGEKVIDFGQNMVGWVQFNVEGMKGEEVILKHAEVLDKDGNFYTDNLRRAKQTINYILKGEGRECFEPHFTFQGFRYIKLEKYPGIPKLEDFTGKVIHSAMDHTGEFSCSDELINQLQHNILWGQKGNFVDVPTDCPQRDERLGWTGDAQVFARTASFNMNTAPFFTKWLRDLKADQSEKGAVPHVIPNVLEKPLKSNSACGWGDAAVIVPWTVYMCYGDLKLLEEQYDSMKAYVEHIRKASEDGLLWNTGFHFGDWLALDAKEGSYFGATPNDLTATAFYAHSTSIVAKAAEALGKAEDVKCYGQLRENIVKAFQREFITPRGRLAAPTQTAHVLALMFDLVEEKDRKRTIDTLVKLLEQNNWHLNTGFLGTPYLCHVLSSNGYADIAYKLLFTKDYPSWLYQITKGATTIWEHWDGIKQDGSFWSADMNSFNHYAYGSIGDWLYRVIAGINIDETKPGYKNIRIEPIIDREKLSFARAAYKSMYGKVLSAWKVEGNNINVEIAIPVNTTATIVLPVSSPEEVLESKEELTKAEGILAVSKTDKGIAVTVGSGSYSFTYKVR